MKTKVGNTLLPLVDPCNGSMGDEMGLTDKRESLRSDQNLRPSLGGRGGGKRTERSKDLAVGEG